MSQIKDLVEFHRKFAIPANIEPGFLEESLMQMRLNFLLEELLETATAAGFIFLEDQCKFVRQQVVQQEDLHAIVDGLIDLVYVALGTAEMMGLGCQKGISSIWDEAWRRVHQANLKKVRVVDATESKRGHSVDLRKPKGWQPPTFNDLLFTR